MTQAGETKELQLRTVEALCRLSERCQAVAKFAEFQLSWYGKAEQYAKAASALMDDVIRGQN